MLLRVTLSLCLLTAVGSTALAAQEARRRWDRLCQIRKEKFDVILPTAMRENNIDMWITVQKEGNYSPLYEDLGRGYTGSIGFYIFTDTGAAEPTPVNRHSVAASETENGSCAIRTWSPFVKIPGFKPS